MSYGKINFMVSGLSNKQHFRKGHPGQCLPAVSRVRLFAARSYVLTAVTPDYLSLHEKGQEVPLPWLP